MNIARASDGDVGELHQMIVERLYAGQLDRFPGAA